MIISSTSCKQDWNKLHLFIPASQNVKLILRKCVCRWNWRCGIQQDKKITIVSVLCPTPTLTSSSCVSPLTVLTVLVKFTTQSPKTHNEWQTTIIHSLLISVTDSTELAWFSWPLFSTFILNLFLHFTFLIPNKFWDAFYIKFKHL